MVNGDRRVLAQAYRGVQGLQGGAAMQIPAGCPVGDPDSQDMETWQSMDNAEALTRLLAVARTLGNPHVERAAKEALGKLSTACVMPGAQVIPFPSR